jgi:hypothetical protein
MFIKISNRPICLKINNRPIYVIDEKLVTVPVIGLEWIAGRKYFLYESFFFVKSVIIIKKAGQANFNIYSFQIPPNLFILN